MNSIAKLAELRETISHFRAVPCRMKHENVVQVIPEIQMIDGEGREVVAPPQFERLGFCPREFRARQTACGHTMARYTLKEALETLKDIEEGAPTETGATSQQWEQIEEWLEEWHRIDGEIGRLDHRKGEVEKARAKLDEKMEEENMSSREEVEREFADITDHHQQCVERLNAMGEIILQSLDNLLDRQEST